MEDIKSLKLKNMFKSYYFQYIILGLLLITIPYLQPYIGFIKSGYITTFGTIIIYAVVAIGMNLLLGYSGLISLGTAGFMGLAAYLASNFTLESKGINLPFFVSFALAVLIPVAIGLLVGVVSLRVEGYYLAIATLAISEIFRKLFETLTKFTGSFQGSKAKYPNILGYQFDRVDMFVFMVVVLVILMILAQNLIHSQTGRAMLTMRGSDAAAQAMGINILKYRVIVFGLATMFASIGGVLYVHFIRLAYPTDWTLSLSLNVVAIIIIGGLYSIGGALLGSVVVIGFSDLVFKQIPVIGEISGLHNVFTGVLIILILLFYPHGLIKIFPDSVRLIIKGIKNIPNLIRLIIKGIKNIPSFIKSSIKWFKNSPTHIKNVWKLIKKLLKLGNKVGDKHE